MGKVVRGSVRRRGGGRLDGLGVSQERGEGDDDGRVGTISIKIVVRVCSVAG